MRLRATTREVHKIAEQSPFVVHLLAGRLGIDAYADLAGQLWYIYRELEAAVEELADHPVVGPLCDPALFRTGALERDLAYLRDACWRRDLKPLPATEVYAARLRQVVQEWPLGYIAHHYTRYMGDLAGGQIVRDVAEKTWGFAPRGDGVRFYVFEQVDNPVEFRRRYRSRLDALPVDEAEKRRIVEEVKRAFTLNTALFQDLDKYYPLGV
jgi:heme oxygenase